MGKDRKARRDNRITTMALANVVAALVDAARVAELPNTAIHHFVDCLDRLNSISLSGPALELLDGFIEVIRETVPSND